MEPLSNKFRLYFLCECGEHTKSIHSKIHHRLHLARHEGHTIIRPKEFFQQYGFYVLTILKMLKYGLSAGGVTTPAALYQVTTSMDPTDDSMPGLFDLAHTMEPGVDRVIDLIERVSVNEAKFVDKSFEEMGSNELLEGVDLHQLDSFLMRKDRGKTLGNLHRILTAEGHVKWICRYHYYEHSQEKAVKAFRDTLESLRGSFDENIGRAYVRLQSKAQAEQFHLALDKTRAVFELKIKLDWETTQGDFKRLRDALAKTNVGVLELDLNYEDGPTSDFLHRSRRHDPLFDIMRQSSIQCVTIIQPPGDLFKRSSLQSRKDDFPNLRRLDIDIHKLDSDIPGLKRLLLKAPNLTGLNLNGGEGWFLQAYTAIAPHQTYPITFQSRSLRILAPMRTPLQTGVNVVNLSGLFTAHGGRIETLTLSGSELDDSTVESLANGTRIGSVLKEFVLKESKGRISEQSFESIAGIVARSRLHRLELDLKAENACVQVLETIQWKHIRRLAITMDQETLRKAVMKALVKGGLKKTSGRIDLEDFALVVGSDGNTTFYPQDKLLESFIASVSLRRLQLNITLSFEQVLCLLKSVDLVRMQQLILRCSNFDPMEVKTILDILQHATELETVVLHGAWITNEQSERMRVNGVTLKSNM